MQEYEMYQMSPVTSFGGMKSMYGIGGVNTIFFSLHNALSASYKENSCPVFVPFFSEKSRKLLSISSLQRFRGGYRIALGSSKLFKSLVINFGFLLIKRFTKSFCPVFVPGHDRLKFY